MKRSFGLLLASFLLFACILPVASLAATDEAADWESWETTDWENGEDWFNPNNDISQTGGYVFDLVGILTQDERTELEQLAAETSARYDSGVYIVVVNDYTDYSSAGADDAAMTVYQSSGFGLGEDRDGVILLLSMSNRDYGYVAHGEFGNYAFTDYGKAQLEREFLDNFRDDDWYGGFRDFITESDYYMAQAQAGTPIDTPPKEPMDAGAALAGSVGLGAAASCAGSALKCRSLSNKMKSVKTKADASQYMSAAVAGGLILRASTDQFINTTVRRIPIRVDNNNRGSGGGGGTTVNSGGFSGHSGKF